MNKTLAFRHLSRLVAETGPLSFPASLTDGTIALEIPEEDKPIQGRLSALAASDGELNAEARALASERRWRLLDVAVGHERWARLDASRLRAALPRIYRILNREAWEAKVHARICDDDDVASMLMSFANERSAALSALVALDPQAAKLGA